MKHRIDPFEISIAGASCTVWPEGPLWNDETTATIGRLNIADKAAGSEIIMRACDELGDIGAKAIIAPMDGDTWHSYRAVLDGDGSPQFLLEPTSGPYDLELLLSAGFSVQEEYFSARAPVPGPGTTAPEVPGITVSQWDGEGAEELVRQLHAHAANSFADKLFYKPLDVDGFQALYAPVMSFLDPRLVFFAHNSEGQLVGFLFGVPNFAEGPSPTQAILKTYSANVHGAGYLLAWHFHETAREMGFSNVIHALMHSENRSLESSKLFSGAPFRRYGILGKSLVS